MCRKTFFNLALYSLFFFFLGTSLLGALNPSYLFLNSNQVNVANVDMVLLITPTQNFSSGSELTLSFPDDNDDQWCRNHEGQIPVSGITSSVLNIQNWEIDTALPGELTAICYQGNDINSHDRIVVSGIGALSSAVSYALKFGSTSNLATGSAVGANNIIVELQRGWIRDTAAFAVYLETSTGIFVQAFLNQDKSSVVQVLNPTVERGIWSTVRVRILDSAGNPLSGRNVSLVFDSPIANSLVAEQISGFTNSNGIFQTRVRSFTRGFANIKALDRTFAQNIEIHSFGILNIVDVPTITLHTLAPISSGLSQTITWNSLGSSYMYFIEASKSPTFNTISSGWISANEFTFHNLEHGVPYYYRGKARNIAGAESVYSNVVSSVQGERPSGMVEVLDRTVERGIWSRIRVRVVDSLGNPMSGRRIVLNIDRSDLSRWEIQNPVGLTDANGIAEGRIRGFEVVLTKVIAIDKTTQDFYLEGFDWLQIVPVPMMNLHSLPLYSKGLTREIAWNLLSGNYEYYLESSTDPTFVLTKDSGWIRLNRHAFTELKHAQGHFYRGKVRNSAGIESAYSNIVSSIQDNEPPAIREISFEVVGDEIKFVFSIDSISPLFSISFSCQDLGSCGKVSSRDRFHTITVSKEELRRYRGADDIYVFDYCMNSVNIVGNEGSLCGKKSFSFDKVILEEKAPSRNLVQRILAPITSNIQTNIENTVIYIQDLGLNDQALNKVSIGLVSTVAPLTIITLSPQIFNFYALVQGFLASTVLLRRGKKARPYGYVYDSVTKDPINRAIIRIYQNNKLITTTVTNVYGIFVAELKSGEYFLKASMRGYSYPSKLITSNIDSPLENVHRGEKFIVKEKGHMEYSIPLDPLHLGVVMNLKTKIRNVVGTIFFTLQRVFVVIGLFLALFMYIRTPDFFNLTILLIYLPLLFVHMFFSLDSKRHSFGIVTDSKGQALQGVSIGLRELEFEKLIAKRVTDQKGKYKFLVPGGKYILEILNSKYEIISPKGKRLVFEGNVKNPLLINERLVLQKRVTKVDSKKLL